MHGGIICYCSFYPHSQGEAVNQHDWKQFLFGTPQRILTTAGVLFALVALATPGLMGRIITQVMNELILPLAQLAIMILVLGYAFKKIFGVGGNKKSSGH
jgi:hypothetical protein